METSISEELLFCPKDGISLTYPPDYALSHFWRL